MCGLRGPGSAAAASGRAHSLERTTRSLNMLLISIQGHKFEIYKPNPSPAWAGLVGNNISRYQKFRVFPRCPGLHHGLPRAALATPRLLSSVNVSSDIILRLSLLHALHGTKVFSVREDSALFFSTCSRCYIVPTCLSICHQPVQQATCIMPSEGSSI